MILRMMLVYMLIYHPIFITSSSSKDVPKFEEERKSEFFLAEQKKARGGKGKCHAKTMGWQKLMKKVCIFLFLGKHAGEPLADKQ